MATYTSTQDGNWTDTATWGGGGYPSANADVVNIAHKVSYNAGVNTITYGVINVNNGGMLIFPPDSSWKLTFSTTGSLIVNSGGDVRIGTSTEIQEQSSSTVGQLHFPQGTSNRAVLTTRDGSYFNLSGSNAVYTEKYGYLKDDWTSGQSLVLSGDMTCWQVGQRFWIHRNSDAYISSGFRYQCNVFTIATITYDGGEDETTITISETAPAQTYIAVNSYSGYLNKIVLLTRNVEILDTNASWTAGNFVTYTERIRWSNAQSDSNNNISVKDVVFLGLEYGIAANYNITLDNVVFHNCNYGLYQTYYITGTVDFICCRYATYQAYYHNLTGFVGGCEYGCNQTQHSTFNGDIVLAYFALQTPTNYTLNGNMVLCNNGLGTGTNTIVNGNVDRCGTSTYDGYGVYAGSFNTINGNLIKNFNALYNATDIAVNGNFSYNESCAYAVYEAILSGNFSNNTTCIQGFRGIVRGKFESNTTAVSLGAASTLKYLVAENCNINSSTVKPYEVYKNSGSIITLISSDANWQSPPSSIDWILSINVNSYCSLEPLYQMPLNPINDMAIPTIEGSYTFTMKVYPVGWTSLTNTNLKLKVSYVSNADGMQRTIVYNTTASYSNGSWNSVSVSIAPAATSIVYYNLNLTKYESGAYLLVDPGVSIE